MARSFRALRKSVINPHRPCPTLPLTGELGTTVCPISNTSGGLKTEKELSAEIFPANNEQNSQLIQHLFSCFKGTTTTAYPHNFKVCQICGFEFRTARLKCTSLKDSHFRKQKPNTSAINDCFMCPKSFTVLLNIAKATFIPYRIGNPSRKKSLKS